MRASLVAACIIGIASPAAPEVIRFGASAAGTLPGSISAPRPDVAVLRYDARGRLIQPPPPAIEPIAAPVATSPKVLAGQGASIALVREVATRHQGHASLARAGLSADDWAVFFQAMIRVESGYRQEAVSRTGAIGLAQLMPETAHVLRVDAHDPVQNLEGGARYLLAQLARFGSLELALAAYNAGPEAVEKYRGIPPYAETTAHVAKVMAEYHRLKLPI